MRGPLHLAPIGSVSGRFDLSGVPCAYLAEAPDTALFETIFRRESTGASVAGLQLRELLAVQIQPELVVGDHRPHATAWPVLQSLRFSETQALAAGVHQAGVVLFDPDGTAAKESSADHDTLTPTATATSITRVVRSLSIAIVPGSLMRASCTSPRSTP